GLFAWVDTTVANYNSTNSWWCKASYQNNPFSWNEPSYDSYISSPAVLSDEDTEASSIMPLPTTASTTTSANTSQASTSEEIVLPKTSTITPTTASAGQELQQKSFRRTHQQLSFSTVDDISGIKQYFCSTEKLQRTVRKNRNRLASRKNAGEISRNVALNSICNETSKSTYECFCGEGWSSVHCEKKIDYCTELNVSCQNKGICAPLFKDFECCCLTADTWGRYCEEQSTSSLMMKDVRRGLGCIAWAALGIVVGFFVVMDILKYGFGTDPVEQERRRKHWEKAMREQVKRRQVQMARDRNGRGRQQRRPQIALRLRYVGGDTKLEPPMPDTATLE
ncbi:unnamed protein product, partial [Didymodactylos carnosus]